MSLRRTQADWPVVGAAWLIMLLSAALFAAWPIYSSAAALAGLQRTLADANVDQTSISVSIYRPPAQVDGADKGVRDAITAAIAPLPGQIVRDTRGTVTLKVAGASAVQPGDRAILGSLDGLAEHATLVHGTWPAPRASASEPIQVAVVDDAAGELGLSVGQTISLSGERLGEPFAIAARVSGTYDPKDVSDPYWHGDERLIRGLVVSGSDRTFGPFMAPPSDLTQTPELDSLHVEWRAYPSFGGLTVEAAPALRQRLEALPDRVQAAVGEGPLVSTGLPRLLSDAERSLLVSRTQVLLLMLQLGIMAAYAVLLTASLLGEHRRVDSALIRSRGAGALQVAWLALGEALLIAVPAVLVAPLIAVAALRILDVVGPLAAVGLPITPVLSLDAYVFAAAAGLVCVVLLVIPTALAARGYAAAQRDLSRQETRTIGQRVGLDIALLAVTAIALWQLRLYGAPLTRTIHGSLGLDPLLVAAPAIGLLSGVIVALRILPGLARAAEAAVSRGRNLVGSLGTRQLARRPLRYTPSALLVMLALSMGVFGVSYASTWSDSQRDQAAYQAGATVRTTPTVSINALPGWALPAAYAKLPGVGGISAVERDNGAVRVGNTSVDLLALDTGIAPDVVLFRPDEASTSLAALMAPLHQARPQPALLTLPDGTTALRITTRADVANFAVFDPDPSGGGEPVPADPSTADIEVAVSATIRDAHGVLYRVTPGPVRVKAPETPIVVSLMPASGPAVRLVQEAGARPDGPVQVVALGVDISIPNGGIVSGGSIGVTALSAGGTTDGPWTEVPLDTGAGWTAEMAQTGGPPLIPPAAQTHGTTIELGGDNPGMSILGGGARVAFKARGIGLTSIPVVANQAFLDHAAVAVGDKVITTFAGRNRQLVISGVVNAFPTTDPARPLLLFDEPTLGLLRLDALGSTRAPDEWWLSTAAETTADVTAALRADPFDSATVISATGRAASLQADPVAVGIIGALMLGAIATGIFAVVGLTVSASVSARQRRTEFALMRALGLSGRQLSLWLWLENGSLVVVSLAAGTALGLLIGWLVLPFVTVTQQGSAPVPSVLLRVPWDQILALDISSAVALGVVVVIIGRVLRRIGVGSVLRMGED